jgi:hypothetical protein
MTVLSAVLHERIQTIGNLRSWQGAHLRIWELLKELEKGLEKDFPETLQMEESVRIIRIQAPPQENRHHILSLTSLSLTP